MSTEIEASRRILVVDDDDVMRELLSALLEVHGYEVLAVDSGQDALTLLEQPHPPELILTDLQMPGLEGEALTAALRNAAPEKALLLGMSGARPSAGTLRWLDNFLSKPFSAMQLEDAIQGARSARDAKKRLVVAVLPEVTDAATAGELAGADDPDGDAAVLDDAIFSALRKSFRPEQLRELYTLTVDDAAQRHGRMEQHAAAGDLEAVQREAHAIKGSCGFVGARELQGLAAAAEGGTTLNTAALADFPAACERLRRMLNAKLQQ